MDPPAPPTSPAAPACPGAQRLLCAAQPPRTTRLSAAAAPSTTCGSNAHERRAPQATSYATGVRAPDSAAPARPLGGQRRYGVSPARLGPTHALDHDSTGCGWQGRNGTLRPGSDQVPPVRLNRRADLGLTAPVLYWPALNRGSPSACARRHRLTSPTGARHSPAPDHKATCTAQRERS